MEYFKQRKICNCLFPKDKYLLKNENKHSYCQKCRSIMLKDSNGRINFTIKENSKQIIDPTNPIDIIKLMNDKTKQYYPYLDNLEKTYESNKFYLINRKMIIFHLQKMMRIFNYNDIVFYQSLFFMDYVFSRQIEKELSENEIIYNLIGYFLFSTKFKECGIGETSIENFVKIKKNTLLSKKQIAFYEVSCLKSINYNIFNYSAYDWIKQLISVGIVFDCEVDSKNSIIFINGHRYSIIKLINRFALKLLLNLTLKNNFLQFSPKNIAFSIIQIARENFLDPNLINQNLFNRLINVYGVNFQDYKVCYEQIKIQILNQNIQGEKNEPEKNNKENDNAKNLKGYIKENNFIINMNKINNHLFLNKTSFCQTLLEPDKNDLKENFEKVKVLDYKTKFKVIKNKLKDKIALEDESKTIQKINKIPNYIRLNNIISKKVDYLYLNRNKKNLKKNNSLPMIDSKIKLNVELIKEKDEKKSFNCSKILGDFEKPISIFSYNKKIYLNKNKSNLIKNISKINSLNKTLYGISSRNKNNLFKKKIKIEIKRNKSIENKSIFKSRKISNFFSSNNRKFEDSKINYNNELLDKFVDQNTIKYKRNLKHNFKIKGGFSSLPNKINQSVDNLFETNSKKKIVEKMNI